MREINIWWLKHKARRQYNLYRNLLDEWSCGTQLAEYISSDLSKAKCALNVTVNKLKSLGEEVNAL